MSNPTTGSSSQNATGTIVSKDGTTIAYDRHGGGPALILVGGAFDDRNSPTAGSPLAALLATTFTVFAYDRRGRGESGDTPPYAVAREVEDLAAIIGEAGGSAMMYGLSSGCALALEAAASGLPITKLALYEPPFSVDADMAEQSRVYSKTLKSMLAEGRRGDAVALFMTRVGMPEPMVEEMRHAPMWPALEAMAHTLAYDSAVMGDIDGGTVPSGLISSINATAHIIAGGASPEWMRMTARAVAKALPNGSYEVLENQTHDVDINALAPALRKFFIG